MAYQYADCADVLRMVMQRPRCCILHVVPPRFLHIPAVPAAQATPSDGLDVEIVGAADLEPVNRKVLSRMVHGYTQDVRTFLL